MLDLNQQCGMPDPGHGGFAVTSILPQESPVIRYPLRRVLTTAKISSKTAQHERKARAECSVTQITRQIGKASIIITRRPTEQLAWRTTQQTDRQQRQ